MMTLFWVIFDPGRVDIGLPEVAEGDETPLRNDFAMFTLATYEIFVCIVFLNLLVAVMNNAVQKIHDRRNLYWRFVRTGIMIDFFDSSSAIPAPFTIANMLWVLCFGLYRLCKKGDNNNNNNNNTWSCCRGPTRLETNRRRGHALLMRKLIRNYLKRRKLRDNNDDDDLRREDLIRLKKEIVEELSFGGAAAQRRA